MKELYFYNRSVLIGTLFSNPQKDSSSMEQFLLVHLKKHFKRSKRDGDSNSLLVSMEMYPSTYLFDDTRQFSYLEWEEYIDNCTSIEDLLTKTKDYVIIDYSSILFRKIVSSFSKSKWIEIETYYYKQVANSYNKIKNFKRDKEEAERFYRNLNSINIEMDALTYEYNLFILDEKY